MTAPYTDIDTDTDTHTDTDRDTGPLPMFDITHTCKGREMLTHPMRSFGLTINIAMLCVAGWFLISRMDFPPVQTKLILMALFLVQALRPLWQNPDQVVGRLLLGHDSLAVMGGRLRKNRPANEARLIPFAEVKDISAFGYTLGITKRDGTADSIPLGPKTQHFADLIRQRMTHYQNTAEPQGEQP